MARPTYEREVGGEEARASARPPNLAPILEHGLVCRPRGSSKGREGAFSGIGARPRNQLASLDCAARSHAKGKWGPTWATSHVWLEGRNEPLIRHVLRDTRRPGASSR
eukprot:9432386-Alexandrium_andersonii.AAC.1